MLDFKKAKFSEMMRNGGSEMVSPVCFHAYTYSRHICQVENSMCMFKKIPYCLILHYWTYSSVLIKKEKIKKLLIV